MALHFTHQHLLWLRSVNYFMQCLHAFSTGLKLAMKFFFFSFFFFIIYSLEVGSMRLNREVTEPLAKTKRSWTRMTFHIVSSAVWLKVFPDILPSVILLNYEHGTVTDILMPEE